MLSPQGRMWQRRSSSPNNPLVFPDSHVTRSILGTESTSGLGDFWVETVEKAFGIP